jgi:hypothetical protein
LKSQIIMFSGFVVLMIKYDLVAGANHARRNGPALPPGNDDPLIAAEALGRVDKVIRIESCPHELNSRVGTIVKVEIGHRVDSGLESTDGNARRSRGLYDERTFAVSDQEIAAAVSSPRQRGLGGQESVLGMNVADQRERVWSAQASSPSCRLVTATAMPASLTPNQVPISGNVPSGP